MSEKLIFNDNAFVAEVWPGDALNASTVDLVIKTYRYHYDADYGTEEEIVGSYDLSLDEARELYEFLGKVLNSGESK